MSACTVPGCGCVHYEADPDSEDPEFGDMACTCGHVYDEHGDDDATTRPTRG